MGPAKGPAKKLLYRPACRAVYAIYQYCYDHCITRPHPKSLDNAYAGLEPRNHNSIFDDDVPKEIQDWWKDTILEPSTIGYNVVTGASRNASSLHNTSIPQRSSLTSPHDNYAAFKRGDQSWDADFIGLIIPLHLGDKETSSCNGDGFDSTSPSSPGSISVGSTAPSSKLSFHHERKDASPLTTPREQGFGGPFHSTSVKQRIPRENIVISHRKIEKVLEKEAKRVMCGSCGKFLGDQRALDRHRKTSKACSTLYRSHTKSAGFNCICGKQYPRKDSLLRHLKNSKRVRNGILHQQTYP
ncbi:hypothetical protein BS50DRAFT_321710 [Corynespora cassiicola Philippines]|uniref:C2H2-type domain-containing protein n=1 Tax=Corynespora cassiicola Philippines TaxID=1448308 RepID=A0A2T2NT91_CORCC|nr:hypothetical protein BS50DRAFT_321710 [Corynespora cassiicola Philippines]